MVAYPKASAETARTNASVLLTNTDIKKYIERVKINNNADFNR